MQKLSNKSKHNFESFRKKLFNMVSVGVINQPINRAYDIISTSALLLNLAAAILGTYEFIALRHLKLLRAVDSLTVLFFAIDYALRIFTAKCLYPEKTELGAIFSYVKSFTGIIDLMSFLPNYLPFFFPSGTAVFRIFRVVRILRLFRVNAYYDSLNVITDVIHEKRQQLLSSVFILSVLLLSSSLCMYSLEHAAQPAVFANAFSGIWWATSTLLTVGYGDIYPITPIGKIFGMILAAIGVGVVAIPTGIISAGFVEQYSRVKKLGEQATEEDIHFTNIELSPKDLWAGRKIRDLGLPKKAIIAAIQRGDKTLIPRGDVVLKSGDRLIIGAEALKGEKNIHLREIVLRPGHPWNGNALKDVSISRNSFVCFIKRNGRSLIPYGDLIFKPGDAIFLYSKEKDLDE